MKKNCIYPPPNRIPIFCLLAVELLIVILTAAAALHPATVYEFTAEQWIPIAQASQIGYDEEGRVGVTEMTDGEDILRTQNMALPRGRYHVTLEYNYRPSVWEGGVERRSYVVFNADAAGDVNGEKAWLDVTKNTDVVTLSVRQDSETVRLIAHNDSGIFTLGRVRVEQDMLYAWACVLGWVVLFVLADAFLLYVIPGGSSANGDAEYKACLWALVCIALLTCAPLLQNNGGTQGSDWAFHLSRIEGIAQGLREGQFPVRIYSQAKNGYGYAPSLFYGELLLYFPAVLRLLGMSVQGAYHTFVVCMQMLTAYIGFYSFRQICRNNKTALVGTALYMLSTYHMYKIYWLTAVGEYSAMAFLPLIPAALTLLYGEKMPTQQQARKACMQLTIAFGMLVQVHMLSLEMAALAVGVFCLLNLRRTFSKTVLLTWLKAVALVLLLNLWFLLPFLTLITSDGYNGMYVSAAGNGGKIVKETGLRLSELLGWQKDHNNLGPELWIGAAALVWCALAYSGKNNRQQRELKTGLWAAAFGAAACWISTESFPWEKVGELPGIGRILTAIQFPGRYLTLATLLFIIAALCAIGLLRRCGQARALSVLLLSVSVFGAAMFARDYQAGLDPVYLGDGSQLIYAQYQNSNMAWFYDDLYLPDGAQENRDGFVSETAVTMLDTAQIKQANGITTLTLAEASTQTEYVELPLLYYPGYSILDGQGTLFRTPNGLVGIAIPENFTGNIRVAFREPKRWRLADAVSLFTLAGLGVSAVYRHRKRKSNAPEMTGKSIIE